MIGIKDILFVIYIIFFGLLIIIPYAIYFGCYIGIDNIELDIEERDKERDTERDTERDSDNEDYNTIEQLL